MSAEAKISGKRWLTGDTSSITIEARDGMVVLGIEGRDDVDQPWVDGAWAYLTPTSFSALLDALYDWRNETRRAAGGDNG